jgi:ankyrin repeat protein
MNQHCSTSAGKGIGCELQVNSTDGYGGTVIQAAVRGQNFDIIELLLEKGANVPWLHSTEGHSCQRKS